MKTPIEEASGKRKRIENSNDEVPTPIKPNVESLDTVDERVESDESPYIVNANIPKPDEIQLFIS